MNKLKHIYWFAPFNINGPSTRYRGYYPINYINKNYAISTNFIFPQSSIFKKIKFILLLISIIFFRKKNALILIQKVCSTNLYAKSLKLLVFFNSKNTIYDIDDAEYLRQDPKTLHYFLKKCQSITVGSEKLKEYCKKFNNNVHLITSPVPVHQFKKLKRNKTPNIGWVGYYGKGDKKSFNFSHRESMFKILFPQLKKVKNAFILTIIGVKNEADISEIHAYFKKHPNIKIVTPMNLDWKNDRT